MNKRCLKNTAGKHMPLAANPDFNFSSQYALKFYTHEVVYTFIPKIACSTMRLTIAIENGCIRDETDANWIHANNATFKCTLQDLITAKYTFVILRDPFTRVASCFLDKIVSKSQVAWIFHESVMNRSGDLDDLTFPAFVKLLAKSGNVKANGHWRPQSEFLVYSEYDDYFHIEDFGRLTDSLQQKFGIRVRDARGITRHGSEQLLERASHEDYSTATVSDIQNLRRSGFLPSFRSLFNPDTVATVRSLYRADFDLYSEKVRADIIFE